jgi:hypothetical protein
MTSPITLATRDPYVHGRRVRYVIGDEPGQVNGRRWQRAPQGRGELRAQPRTAAAG